VSRIDRIRERLEGALAPTQLVVTDDSHLHAGHEGARDGRGHFSVRITSAAFMGKAPLARHRAIYAALGDMMVEDIHALAIEAQAPGDNVP
jgi:BolA protein